MVRVNSIYSEQLVGQQMKGRDHPYDYRKKCRVASGITRRP
jgi:hypothetical protein